MSRWRSDHDSWQGSLDDWLTRPDEGDRDSRYYERYAGDMCGYCYHGSHKNCLVSVHGGECRCHAARHYTVDFNRRLVVKLDEF